MDPAQNSGRRDSTAVDHAGLSADPSHAAEPASLNETPKMSRMQKAFNFTKEAAEFITPGVTWALVGVIGGAAAITIGPPLLVGFVIYDAGKKVHEALLEKAEAHHFTAKFGNESPVLEFFKAEAIRTAGEFKNFFTQRLKENIPISDTVKAIASKQVPELKKTIIAIDENINYEEKLEQSSFISHSDRKFYESIQDKDAGNFKDSELNRLANISMKVENRIKAYSNMQELLGENNFIKSEDKKELKSLMAKMSTFPQRALSEGEVKRVFKIYEQNPPAPNDNN